ncbi:hypothetical protein JYK14_17245 [Siccirubricoccus sp. KC 17139]|uniref:Yip1 domain-containing protein n=1 Tax=Siccirubricoccus soli TaxID=2899147 RepID=A0ABT1D7I0_9PROT|nr:hypothetical protein [Siccirubricoccus soli]MCO6417894.1 hypothetical protein [Siccirubricoccus soli]MCP2684029.1 hypothetical protein [Siccirubricoccus soli]
MVIEAGLRGASYLARGRAEGLMLIEDTPAGALRSFWAAAICLPAFLALRLFDWGQGAGTGGFGQTLAAEFLGYVVSWAGFGLASRRLAAVMGRQAEWPHFLAAFNWANVVQYLVLILLTLPGQALPGVLSSGLTLAAAGYALWLEWFIARSALLLPGGQAIGFVALDLLVTLMVQSVVNGLAP